MRVIGTAGHVDHGKSTLIKRLTGIDPDRLAEEKARQLTIDLGFAWLELPGGETVGVIDVPGHRDFIENMLAGIGGIDAALLVIAADEGVMPQTREHLAILDLLGIKNGIVVLSKTDMVDDPDWLDLVEQDVRDTIAHTHLADVPILRVSAHIGDGIPNLTTTLEALLNDLPDRPDINQPRLPVDRVFTISGFGTVVTGTLTGGSLHVGDEIELQPNGLRGRVRGLQSYKQKVETSYPGSRVAVNISGVDKDDVTRGHLLAYPGQVEPTMMVDVFFRYLPDIDRPLKHNSEVKVFSGASEASARVRLLNNEHLAPGEEGWLQLRLMHPLALSQNDRYILRYPSPAQTIGGGVIVDPHPKRRWKRFQPQVIERLATRMEGTPAQRVTQSAEGREPIKYTTLQQQTGYSDSDMAHALNDALIEGILTELLPNIYMATASVRALIREMHDILTSFHSGYPLRLGIPREELRNRVGIKQMTFNALLDLDNTLVSEKSLVRLESHVVTFTEQQEIDIDALFTQMRETPYTPPSYSEATAITGEDVLQALIDLGEIVQVQQDVIFTRTAYEELVDGVLQLIDTEGNVEAKTLRDRFDTSRKFAIGLLEHLDHQGITRRVGDARVRGRNAPQP